MNIFSIIFGRLASVFLVLVMVGCASVPDVYEAKSYPPVVNYALSLEGAPYPLWQGIPRGKASIAVDLCDMFMPSRALQYPVQSVKWRHICHKSRKTTYMRVIWCFSTRSAIKHRMSAFICKTANLFHAPSSRAGKVQISSLENQYWRKHFIGVRRPIAQAKGE